MMNSSRQKSTWIDRLTGGVLVGLVVLAAARSFGLGMDDWGENVPLGPAEPLPQFSARLSDGSILHSEDLRGHVTLLTFWATWCEACGLQMPALVELDGEFEDDELRIIGINRDGGGGEDRRQLVDGYVASKGIQFVQVLDDGRLAKTFGVDGIPHMVVIDRAGEIRYVHYGLTRKRVLEGQVERLLDE